MSLLVFTVFLVCCAAAWSWYVDYRKWKRLTQQQRCDEMMARCKKRWGIK